MRNWWVSWYGRMADHTEFEYHGPWWVSGETFDGRYIYCAAVCAIDGYIASAIIHDSYDRGDDTEIEWRFTNECPYDWSPFNDRFNREDWMRWPWPEDRS